MLRPVYQSSMILTLISLFLAGCTLLERPSAPDSNGETSPSAGEDTASTPQGEASPLQPPVSTPSIDPDSAAIMTKYVLVPERSEARYLVREQLAGLSLPSDAVGRTQEISGQVVVNADGAIVISESQFVVQLSSLRSDESRRDGFVRRNTLETDQHPMAVFVPSQAVGLPAVLPQSGQVNFSLLGDLTIRDETNPVEWEANAEIQGREITGQATTSFTFDEFSLIQPRVPVVLSVEDTIRLEVDFMFIVEREPEPAPMAQEGSESPTPDCSSPASATPAMAEGPYFKAGSPERASLLEADTVGTKLVLSGFVLTRDCQPVAGALLDFWQTDGQGVYDNAGFKLRGHQFTDESGHYQLETVVPGLYPGRTAHIHLKVQSPDGPVLTTQLYFPGETSNNTDPIFSPQLLLEVTDTPDGKQATFNFILDLP